MRLRLKSRNSLRRRSHRACLSSRTPKQAWRQRRARSRSTWRNLYHDVSQLRLLTTLEYLVLVWM